MSEFSSLKIVGGLLSSDLLARVFAGDSQVPGTSAESYGLEKGESVRRQASRSWPYLLETWQDEKKRDRFTRILFRELGFGQQMPEHIAFRSVGWDVSLDHRTPNREARAPQSVMQEQLNRDDTLLWGLLCNGTTLRLLRDSATLVGSSYVEFDLRAIFDGELFSDFVLLYVACHEIPIRGPRRGRTRVLLPGAVAHRERRSGRARSRPAPQGRRDGDLGARHRVHRAPGQPAAAAPA